MKSYKRKIAAFFTVLFIVQSVFTSFGLNLPMEYAFPPINSTQKVQPYLENTEHTIEKDSMYNSETGEHSSSDFYDSNNGVLSPSDSEPVNYDTLYEVACVLLDSKPEEDDHYVQFSSDQPFTITATTVDTGKPYWKYDNEGTYKPEGNGIYYYDGDWDNEWNGSSITSVQIGETYYIFLRGNNNTHLSTFYPVGTEEFGFYNWSFSFSETNSLIYCKGELGYLLDYDQDYESLPYEMDPLCFAGLFCKDSYIATCPSFTSIAKLTDYCYLDMFKGCTSLVEMPVLYSTKLAVGCYEEMFLGCNQLKCPKDFIIPETGISIVADECFISMFNGADFVITRDQKDAENHYNKQWTFIGPNTDQSVPTGVYYPFGDMFPGSNKFSAKELIEGPLYIKGYKFNQRTLSFEVKQNQSTGELSDEPWGKISETEVDAYLGSSIEIIKDDDHVCEALHIIPPAEYTEAEEIIVYATPSDATEQYTYKFEGWAIGTGETSESEFDLATDAELITDPVIVSEDITINAVFSKTPVCFQITWKNWDGTILETDAAVTYGALPTYDGATPTKPSSGNYTYTFNGWQPTITPAYGDAVYTATFQEHKNGGGGGSSGGGGGAAVNITPTYCDSWLADENGNWKCFNPKTAEFVKSAWLSDNAVAANGQNVWYLMNTDGTMLVAPLVRDNTGRYYSLETQHNGYYGSLRYKNGTYDGIYMEFSQAHDGTFGAITNQSAIDALNAKYGTVLFPIDNSSCVYTSTFYN